MAIKRTNLGGGNGVTFPPLQAGSYFFPLSPNGTGTNATPGIGQLRAAPWVVRTGMTIDRLGAEISAAGEAGAKLRLGIWADTGDYRPGALVLDAGQLNADASGVAVLTVAVDLPAGVYWLGAAVQNVVTTQPTLRTVLATWEPTYPLATGTSVPAPDLRAASGVYGLGVTGAFAGTFPTITATTSSIPRFVVRVA